MSGTDFLETLLNGVSVAWRAIGEVTLPTGNIRWRDTDRTYRYIDLTSVSILKSTEFSSDHRARRCARLWSSIHFSVSWSSSSNCC